MLASAPVRGEYLSEGRCLEQMSGARRGIYELRLLHRSVRGVGKDGRTWPNSSSTVDGVFSRRLRLCVSDSEVG